MMRRRAFLRLLGFGAVAVVTHHGVNGNEALPRSAWHLEWFEKEFLFDGKVGYAIRATHRMTGEVRAIGARGPLLYGPGRHEQRQRMKAWLKGKILETTVA